MSTKKIYSLEDFGSKSSIKKPLSKPKEQVSKSSGNKFADAIILDLDSVVDLQRVHRHVLSIFGETASKINEKNRELSDIISATYKTIEEEVLAETHEMSLKEEIEMLRDKVRGQDEYLESCIPLLDRYQKLIPEDIRRVVGGDESVISVKNYENFQLVVSQFIDLAMRFSSQIKVIVNSLSIENCPCGGAPIIIDNIAICPQCQSEIKLRESSFGGSKNTRSDYYRSETFEEYIDECQGRRKKPIPTEIYQTISKHCVRHNIPEDTLTKSDIFRILKKYKLSDYYKSINLISHVLIDTPLPDIQKYKAKLLERHRLIEQEYIELRDSENRSNFLYAWYVLRACLSMEGYDAKADDFITLTTRDAAIEHNRFMIKICDRIKEKQKTDSSIKGNWNFTGLR